MLTLDQDQWAVLMAISEFRLMLEQMADEYRAVRDALAERAILDADSAERTAINYALNCGRLEAIREIVNYEPKPREETDDGQG